MFTVYIANVDDVLFHQLVTLLVGEKLCHGINVNTCLATYKGPTEILTAPS